MKTTQADETYVTVSNSPIQDYPNPHSTYLSIHLSRGNVKNQLWGKNSKID